MIDSNLSNLMSFPFSIGTNRAASQRYGGPGEVNRKYDKASVTNLVVALARKAVACVILCFQKVVFQ